MKLRAKTFPKHFKLIRDGEKSIEYRNVESITFVNSETAEEMTYEVKHIKEIPKRYNDYDSIRRLYPDIQFFWEQPLVKIELGKRIGQDCNSFLIREEN